MSQGLPIVIIVIAIILAVVALMALTVWRKQKEGRLEKLSLKNKKALLAQWIIGIILALTAAFFMWDGDILGVNTTGIASIVGIVGLCLIATANVTLLVFKRKSKT